MFSKFFTFSLSAFIALVFMDTASICLAQGNTWATKTDMPTSRQAHSSCDVNGKIYVMGGMTSIGCDFPISKVEEYDPSTDTWDPTKTDMPTPRESFGLSAVNGKIYAIGGQANNCSSYLSVVEEYDPSTDTWDPTKTDMLTPRGGLSTSVVNGKIYAIGGHNTLSGTPLTTVEEYDPLTDSWETKEPMPHARTWFSTTVVDGNIYAFPQWWGGPDSIDVYDPVNDTWETIDRPELGADCSASTVNGLIYTFGGLGFMNDVWEYNPVSNNWSPMSPMPTGRADAPATEVNGKIYVIGGSTTPWPSTPSSKVEEYTPPVPNVVFEDNFDSYTVGEQLACQNPTDWTTWSLVPCDPVEDAYVSDLYAFSGSNSVVIVQNTDLVKTYGNITSGKDSIAFMIYIPTGKNGFFATYAGFTGGDADWGMSVRFFPGGSAQLNATAIGVTTFTYAYDTWQNVKVIVDLDNDIAEFWFDGAIVYTWQWTLGSLGEGVPLQLAASGFYGFTLDDEMYVDDFGYDVITSIENEVDVKDPLSFGLDQNYPNPFNPSTTIKYEIKELDVVTIKVYGVLGCEIITLVNEEKPVGSYEIEFNASHLPSGVYFYQLKAGYFVETKKMMLMK